MPNKERAERVIVNLNKLYSPEKPVPEKIVEYYNKMWAQLPTDLKGKNIVLYGTAPRWLIGRLVVLLMGSVDIISFQTPGSEYEYLIYYANNKLILAKPRKIV